MGYSRDITDHEYQLLCRLGREVDEFFKVSYIHEQVCANDIYDFIKNRPALRGEFPTGKDFSRFLRKMHHKDVLKTFVCYYADTSIYHHYKWKFCSKAQKLSDEVLATSRKGKSTYFKNQLSKVANDNGNVRSGDELYIQNRLLNEEDFDVAYEGKTYGKNGGWKLTDFIIRNKRTDKVYHWEHAGMAADHEYALKTHDTIPWYIDNGFVFIQDGGTLILTYNSGERAFARLVETMIASIKEDIQ